jgi:hypothetical protein
VNNLEIHQLVAGKWRQIALIKDYQPGRLSIDLKNEVQLALCLASDSNPFNEGGTRNATRPALNANERFAKQLKACLDMAARLGDRVELNLSGSNNNAFALVTGDRTLSFANGPISLDLQPGQTEIAFAFLNTGDVDSDAQLNLTATYLPGDGGAQATYDLTLNLDATDEPADQNLQTTLDIGGDIGPMDFYDAQASWSSTTTTSAT